MRAPVTDLPIVLEDVSFSAGGVTILDRISLVLVAGSPTVLIGPNGAGKTDHREQLLNASRAVGNARYPQRIAQVGGDCAPKHRWTLQHD